MKDLGNWPRVIQLAWAFYDKQGSLLDQRVDLIKPDGWKIPKEKFWIENGFDQATSEEKGIPIIDALNKYQGKLELTKTLVAHNMNYDYNVVGAEFLRAGLKSNNRPKRICTMDASTNLCKIPGRYNSYKWPTLSELHIHLFNEDFEGRHDALADVQACARCFLELLKRDLISN